MAGNRFVMDQRGQVVFAMQVGGAQVDPHLARNAAVLAARPAIGGGRARLLGQRQAAHLQRRSDQRFESARHLRADPVDPVFDEGEDFGAAFVPFGEFEALVFRQSAHAFANGPADIADGLQDRVHTRVDRGQLLAPLPVDFGRGEAGGGGSAQRPGVIFLALRSFAHARRAGGDGALRLQFRQLAFEHGDYVGGDDRRGAGLQGGAGQPRRRGFGAERRGHRPPAVSRIGNGLPHLFDRAIQQEIGRHHAHGARAADPLQLSAQRGGHRAQPVEVEFGVLCIAHRLFAFEEARHVEIGADILDHDIGRVAPAADRNIAIGQREAVQRGGIGAADHFPAGALRRREVGLRQPAFRRLDAGSQGLRVTLLPGGRLVLDPAAQRGVAVGIDAQRGGAFGLMPQQRVGKCVELPLRAAVEHRHPVLQRLAGAGGQGEQRGPRTQGCEGLATVHAECIHARETATARAGMSNA